MKSYCKPRQQRHFLPTKIHNSNHVWMWELDHKKSWVPKNWYFWSVVLVKTLKSPLDCKEIKPVSPEYSLEGLCWSWSSSTLITWCEEPTHWKRPWCWEKLRVGGQGGNRAWDGWMTSPSQWTWVSKFRKIVKDREVSVLQSIWCAAVHRVPNSWTTCVMNNNNTEL